MMQEPSTVDDPTVPPRDFTYEMYAALIDSLLAEEFAFATVREYLTESDLPRKLVVLRHDVDRKPENALDIARIEASRDVYSTFYFRTIEKTFKPSLIREIESLGHEIGYHYEDMDRTDGDVRAARASFAREIGRLRLHADVDTVCMHGNPLTSYDNRDLWSDAEAELFDAYDLAGEAYLSVDFADLIYFSDTGRVWRDGSLKVKDYTVGPDAKSVQVDGTADLIEHVRTGETERFYLLTHPNRWAGDSVERVVEATKDAVTNVGKYVLQAASR